MKPISALAAGLFSAVIIASCSEAPVPVPAPQESAPVAESNQAISAGEVLPTGAVCTPSGAHGAGTGMNGHVMRSCQTCHSCGGVLQFANGTIAAPTQFDATSKNCTGGCHSDGNGGPPVVVQPNWYSEPPFPTTTCSSYNGTCGTCNTGAVCCNCHMADNTNTYLTLQTGHHRIHILNHIPCTNCHVDPSGPTHANGTKDVKPTIVLGSGDNTETLVVYRPANTAPAPYAAVCKGTATCVGICHGQTHQPVNSWDPGCW